ncbi:efflux RND transporter periplasmic adaptor subunit [Litorimonas haliclonae]|uniref:efflux RND transporter periplasmic adaptor subunit n=1 Tax=Litorimonas haliclonae TaxID=2081977 RepID=UPI0039F12A5D
MKLNKSFLIAGALLAFIIIWFIVNNLNEEPPAIGKTQAEIQSEAQTKIPAVQVKSIQAQEHENVLELYGQTESAREVTVKAQTSGLVVSVPAAEGRIVNKGALVCRQDVDARAAMVDQARANLKSIENDLRGARVLAEKGFQSETRVIGFEAQMDGARASLKQAEIELDNVNIRAPFQGVWEEQLAQVGDYLSPGQPCGLIVDLSPLKVIAQLTEKQVGLVSPGETAIIELATGETVEGKIDFIEAKSDTATRTFRAEILVPNEEYKLKAGVTATVRITAGKTTAQRIPSNILTLNDAGEVGVRYLDRSDVVRFAQVKVIDETPDGSWVTGLPDETRIIIEGQDYVAVGQTVEPNANYNQAATQ